MFKKVFNLSGRRILKAIKKLSTRSRVVRKSQQKTRATINHLHHHQNQVICEFVPSTIPAWTATYMEPEVTSLSWSIPSLDAKSVDTYVTYVMESLDECNSMCCYCMEHENQRNENRENEMII
ncbi:hypothetical protein PV327_005662 [Microctonus hyperodae]|uniref:Uncharacterized protein n=1 Tax=Microctonus hyperodae TaxID=165561 RepID=A0AA39G1U5_MICHY|nr:hypothetical protein PV327_005662 [Microctonus hyperodae]